ncbi:hypothetical protein HHK36_001624 [Tetracentron sinense]|uniref:GH16 domain-containing protein n=1 Tax=Tetracentron sinense TaxID=13715 RepID=A0A835A413_TETSI|nr:hypothetical protein HHK36_001624 [Tetracentron sinense]
MSLFSSSDVSVMLFLSLLLSSFMAATASNIYQDFDLIWGDNRATILSSGQLLTHSLDMVSSSSFQSKREYLFRRIYMQLELALIRRYRHNILCNSQSLHFFIVFNSLEVVIAILILISMALQLSSQGATHDEIDVKFLRNHSGDPYILRMNVFTQGEGEGEGEGE